MYDVYYLIPGRLLHEYTLAPIRYTNCVYLKIQKTRKIDLMNGEFKSLQDHVICL